MVKDCTMSEWKNLLDPSNIVDTGRLDGVVGKINNARLEVVDIKQKDELVEKLATCLLFDVETDEEVIPDVRLKCGDASAFRPSEDTINPAIQGHYLVAVGTKSSIHPVSGAAVFFTSLAGCGFDPAQFQPVSNLNGLKVLFGYKSMESGKDADAFKWSSLICASLVEVDQNKVKAFETPAGTAPAAAAPGTAAAPAADLLGVMAQFLWTALSTMDGGPNNLIQKSAVQVQYLIGIKDHPQKKDLTAAFQDNNILAQLVGTGIVAYDPTSSSFVRLQ